MVKEVECTENKEELEKVILVAVSTGNEEDAQESLDELEELVSTAGAVVVGRVVQNLEHINNYNLCWNR